MQQLKKNLVIVCLLLEAINVYGVIIEHFDFALNSKTKKATIVGFIRENYISSVLNIPSVIEYEGEVYGVTRIEDHVFSGWKELTWVEILAGLESIGEGAFQGCTELWHVDLSRTTISEIGAWAFAGCTKLQVFVTPPYIKQFGRNVFDGCVSLGTAVFNSFFLKEIPYGACRGCKSLRTVLIGSTIKKIGDRAFEGSAIMLLMLPSSIENIGWYAFKDCMDLEMVLSSIMDPFVFEENVFSNYETVVLEVPKGTFEKYMKVRCWNMFSNVVEANEHTGILSPKTNESKEMETYSIDGKKVINNSPGLKIIRTQDGVKKVISKK